MRGRLLVAEKSMGYGLLWGCMHASKEASVIGLWFRQEAIESRRIINQNEFRRRHLQHGYHRKHLTPLHPAPLVDFNDRQWDNVALGDSGYHPARVRSYSCRERQFPLSLETTGSRMAGMHCLYSGCRRNFQSHTKSGRQLPTIMHMSHSQRLFHQTSTNDWGSNETCHKFATSFKLT